MAAAKQYIVGLTGGIGSGKSTAANIFGELGAAIVDVDLIAHELTSAGGGAMADIRAVFGDAALSADGALDRAAMRRRVFAEPADRARLEAILHPLIRSEADRRLAAGAFPYVVLVVPLLIESGDYRQRCDRIVVVDCAEATQIARASARAAVSAEDVKRIMAAQTSRAQRRAAANDIINNDGSFEALRHQVEGLHRIFSQLGQSGHCFG